MANDPNDVIDRQDYNDHNYSRSLGNTHFKWPADLTASGGESEPFMFFKFHSAEGKEKEPRLTTYGFPKFVALPIPPELASSDSYNYSSQTGIAFNLKDRIDAIFDKGMNSGYNIFSGTDRARRAGGMAPNLASAVIFESPEFRTYKFDWTLIPRNKSESDYIHRICKVFRLAAAADFQTETDTWFFYPDLVSFFVITKTADIAIPASSTNYYFKSYPCFIEDVTVKYSGGDSAAAFHEDGSPVSIDFSISLKESILLGKKDISIKPGSF